jgi:hypothetical protein
MCNQNDHVSRHELKNILWHVEMVAAIGLMVVALAFFTVYFGVQEAVYGG